jgi:redox-sensitive bicupin YhaK (pirin superfamily)
MMDPRYRGIRSDQIPEVSAGAGVTIRIISGEVNGIKGPVRDIVTDPTYLDVMVLPETEYTHSIPVGHTAFAYVIEGKGWFCQQNDPFTYEVEGRNYFDLKRNPFAENGDLVSFGDGDRIAVSTREDPLRFLLISGKPIGEPVAWYGPIVMNTREELRTAFREYENGTFIKAQA